MVSSPLKGWADGVVKSLAEHFLRGELSTELLRHGTDEEITKALIAVRGIGQVRISAFFVPYLGLNRADTPVDG
jgi:DNA-3-methyladenine glycosylase II